MTQQSTYATMAYCCSSKLKNILHFTKQHKKNHRPWYVMSCFVLLLAFSSESVSALEKYSSVRIHLPQSAAERNDLLGLLEIDHFHENNGAITALLNESDLLKLKSFKCKFEIISKDAITDLISQNDAYFSGLNKGNPASNNRVAFEQSGQTVSNIITTPAAFQIKPTLGGYYSFAEMNTAMDNLVAAFPNIAQKFSIGTTVEGREMWCIKISDNVATDETDEPELLYMGLHHAREAIGGASMIFLMQYLCENYAGNTTIRDLVNNREFFIVVCANPDGWEYNRTTNPNGGGQWRKNRRNNGDGTFGVDLNRNWGIDWADCSGALGGAANCGSGAGSSEVYWGTAAFSEPETVNLRNFVQSRNFAVCMDQHSVGPYYSLPFGRIFRTLSPLDNQIYTQMTSVMGKYNGMRYGNTYQTLGYEVSGGMKDWLLIGDTANLGKIYGMTGEGSNGTSSVIFWPLAAEIVTLCKGMAYQDLQIAYTAGAYVDFQDNGKINITTRNGKFYFNVRRIGLEDKPVTVTVLPLQNITSVGAPKTVASIPNYNGSYRDSITYSLPAIPNGTSIKFVWKIETGGYTYYDTVSNVYNPSIPFTDNMESGKVGSKWTASGGWAYTNDAAYAGTKSLAESPGANYTNSSTRTLTSKTNLNLSGARTAYISFWVKHRSENFRDKLQLQVSTNGTTWVEVNGQSTVREPGTADGSTINGKPSLTGINENWKREVFNISNYFGTSSLRFRMVFTSDAGSSYTYAVDEGFNIDDFTVITSTVAASLTAANNPVSLLGKNEDTKNILQLQVADVADVQQYIIERSTNGVDYEYVTAKNARLNTTNNLIFTDENPYQGENLYRAKIENTDGTYRYTNLVSLTSAQAKLIPTGIQNIFPNPTSGKMQVNFNVTEEQAKFNLLVFNVAGQIVYNEALNLTAGQHTIELNASGFSTGEYFISFSNPDNRVSYESKFVKL